MATLTLTFSAPLNVSCQVGDFAYYVSTSSSARFTINSGSDPDEDARLKLPIHVHTNST